MSDAKREQVWDYGGGPGYFAPGGGRRGDTVRRLCPPCLDNHGRKREIPKNSASGMCRMCMREPLAR